MTKSVQTIDLEGQEIIFVSKNEIISSGNNVQVMFAVKNLFWAIVNYLVFTPNIEKLIYIDKKCPNNPFSR